MSGKVTAVGSDTPARFLKIVAKAFRAEEPDVRLAVSGSVTEDGFARLCAGTADLVAADRAIAPAEASRCQARQVDYFGLHVANADGKRLLLYVGARTLERLEVESLVQFVVDTAQETASQAGLEPLTDEELQETTTTFEQALAGIG